MDHFEELLFQHLLEIVCIETKLLLLTSYLKLFSHVIILDLMLCIMKDPYFQ